MPIGTGTDGAACHARKLRGAPDTGTFAIFEPSISVVTSVAVIQGEAHQVHPEEARVDLVAVLRPRRGPAILDHAVWSEVQAALSKNMQGERRRANAKEPSLLAGWERRSEEPDRAAPP